MTPVIGIDPGKLGAVAFVYPDGSGDALPMPFTIDGEESDYAQLEAYLGDLRLSGICTAYVERLVRYTGSPQPGSAAALYGFNVGVVNGILEAQHWNITRVAPVEWQRHFTEFKTTNFATKNLWKNHLKAIAQAEFPELKVTLTTADALLIARYGFRQTNKWTRKAKLKGRSSCIAY